MCGRYTLTADAAAVAEELELPGLPATYRPRYNIAPMQEVLAVTAPDGEPRAEMLRWGLVPFWAKDPALGSRMINARAETLAEKPAYRGAYRKRRCLVVADGFYEWQKQPGGKQPYRIRRGDGRPFAFAGLWEEWGPKERPLRTCTIVTVGPNALMAPIHDRMPTILEPDERDLWLSPEQDPRALQDVLHPYRGDGLEAYPVSTLVNAPGNDLPACIEPLP